MDIDKLKALALAAKLTFASSFVMPPFAAPASQQESTRRGDA